MAWHASLTQYPLAWPGMRLSHHCGEGYDEDQSRKTREEDEAEK